MNSPTLPGGQAVMLNISVSARSLAAARAVDPAVSAAAVHAAVEAALAEHLRQQRHEPPQHDVRRAG